MAVDDEWRLVDSIDLLGAQRAQQAHCLANQKLAIADRASRTVVLMDLYARHWAMLVRRVKESPQFRLHLRNVYKVMGQRAPARLFQPIIQKAPTPEKGLPTVQISPRSRSTFMECRTVW